MEGLRNGWIEKGMEGWIEGGMDKGRDGLREEGKVNVLKGNGKRLGCRMKKEEKKGVMKKWRKERKVKSYNILKISCLDF